VSVLEVIEKRESVRDYLDEKVNEEDLKTIVETGKKAPKAGPFHITVVTNKELLNQISKLTTEGMINSGVEFLIEKAETLGYNPTYNTPSLIIFSAPDENVYGALTISAAAENVILAARELGYGTCYLISPTLAFSTPKKDELIKSLQIPAGFNPICAVSVGKEGPNNEHPPREELDNINYVK
jgi:nitroreductase